METCDYFIIGGGVIGLNVARALKLRRPDARIVVVEKENEVGAHASGRNSGVIHAGFYYSADSLKAKLTRTGNEMLTAYCLEHELPINRCGKLVVATNEAELKGIDTLLERGRVNGVWLEEIDEKAAKELEPRVKVFGGRALYSPTTSKASSSGSTKLKAQRSTLMCVPSSRVPKLSEGRPNVVDLIKNGEVKLLINTPTRKGPATDEGKIRATAVLNKVPIVTTLTAARAAAAAIGELQRADWGVRPLQEYFAK